MAYRTAQIDLTLTIEGLACGTIEAGKFARFCDAWKAMEQLVDGASTLRLVDGRGVTRSLLVGYDWAWK